MKTVSWVSGSLILFLGLTAGVHGAALGAGTTLLEDFDDGVADIVGEEGFEAPATASGPSDLIFSGETVSAAFSVAGEMDSYAFSAKAGDAVRILMACESGDLSPQVELFDPDGVLVTSEWGSYFASIIGQRLDKTGTYTVVVADHWGTYTGTYGLSLIKMPGSTTSEQDPDGGEIVSGETKTGTIGVADLDASSASSHLNLRV
jgi:hypothetical protein